MIPLMEFLGDPDLDQRLASHAETGCLTVKFGDHPRREVHVHPSVFLTGPPRPSGIPSRGHVLAGIESFVQFL